MILDFSDKGAAYFFGAMLADVLLHLQKVREYTDSISPQDFADNEMIRDTMFIHIMSVRKSLDKISEAQILNDSQGYINNFSKNCQNCWHDCKMLGYRKIMHEYLGFDFTYPWKIVHSDMLALEDDIQTILDNYDDIRQSYDIETGKLKYKIEQRKQIFLETHGQGDAPKM